MSGTTGHGPAAVRHEPEHSRFVVDLRDGEAELVYGEFGENVLDLQHTEVPRSGRGKGVGDIRRHPDERPA